MSKNTLPERPNTSMQASLSDFSGMTYHHFGELRSVALGSKIQPDQMIGVARAIEESIEGAFGKAALDEQLNADQRAYALRPLR